jgi:hypothetical protein
LGTGLRVRLRRGSWRGGSSVHRRISRTLCTRLLTGSRKRLRRLSKCWRRKKKDCQYHAAHDSL